jgi:hypothetical protein
MPRARTRAAALLAGLALLVAIAGCGDDGDGDGEALTREELIEQADEICSTGDAQIDSEAREFSQDNFEDIEGLVREIVVPGLEDEISQLRELEPPPELEQDYTAFVDTLERGTDELQANPEEFQLGGAYKTIRDARQQAESIGMTGCARGA